MSKKDNSQQKLPYLSLQNFLQPSAWNHLQITKVSHKSLWILFTSYNSAEYPKSLHTSKTRFHLSHNHTFPLWWSNLSIMQMNRGVRRGTIDRCTTESTCPVCRQGRLGSDSGLVPHPFTRKRAPHQLTECSPAASNGMADADGEIECTGIDDFQSRPCDPHNRSTKRFMLSE